VRLWRALENIPGWAGVRSVWHEHMGEELEFLEPLLFPMEQLALSVPIEDRVEPYRVVQHADDDIVAVDPETGDVVALDLNDIVLLKLDADTLFRGIASALDLVGTPASVGVGNRLWWLGDFVPIEGERFPVYLATSRDAQELASSAGVISALSLRPFVLATPTRCGASEPLDRLVRGRGAAQIVLDEVLAWEGEGVFASRQPMRDRLRIFLEQHAPASVNVAPVRRFPTPAGATWADVSMRFTDGHTVSVSVLGVTQLCTYEDMGMANKRTKQPTIQWDLLQGFAREHGVLTWSNSAASRQNQKRRERLADALEAFFGIAGDPFEHDATLGGWRARFRIEPD